jgi:hypothetical protein
MTDRLPRILGITALIMVLPLIGSLTAEGWGWSGLDYVFAAAVFFCVVALLDHGLTRKENLHYKLGFGTALLAGFALMWGNAAHGMVGEDNPGNLAYFLLLALSFISASVSRFEAQATARTMFWTAFGLAFIPVIMAAIGGGNFPESPAPRNMGQIFVISMAFAAIFVASGILFRQAKPSSPG